MKKYIVAAVAVCLSMTLSVLADSPPGVGSADISRSPCFTQTTVVGPGNFTPFLPGGLGVLLIEVGEQKVVHTNSAQGNVHLSCHGQLTFGDFVQGWDAITGSFVDGFVATGPETCASFIAVGLPNPCRGQGQNSVVIIDQDFQGLPCLINGVESYDWKAVYAPGRGVSMICHGRE